MELRFFLFAIPLMAILGTCTQKLYVRGRTVLGTNILYLLILFAVIIGWKAGNFLSHTQTTLEKSKVYTVIWCEKNKIHCLLEEEGKDPFYFETGKWSKETLASLEIGKRIKTPPPPPKK